jgi:hypothetical protein
MLSCAPKPYHRVGKQPIYAPYLLYKHTICSFSLFAIELPHSCLTIFSFFSPSKLTLSSKDKKLSS